MLPTLLCGNQPKGNAGSSKRVSVKHKSRHELLQTMNGGVCQGTDEMLSWLETVTAVAGVRPQMPLTSLPSHRALKLARVIGMARTANRQQRLLRPAPVELIPRAPRTQLALGLLGWAVRCGEGSDEGAFRGVAKVRRGVFAPMWSKSFSWCPWLTVRDVRLPPTANVVPQMR